MPTKIFQLLSRTICFPQSSKTKEKERTKKDREERQKVVNEAKTYHNYLTLYTKYAEADHPEPTNRKPVNENEHKAFLYYWLCKYIFCCRSGQCSREYAALAEALASGTSLALGPFVARLIYFSI